MVKIVGIVCRKTGLSPEDFRRHYEAVHVPLVMRFMGADCIRNVRNYPLGKTPISVGVEPDWDCITELTFPDQAAFGRAIAALEAPAAAAAIRADEARFIDPSRTRAAVVEECDQTDGSEVTRRGSASESGIGH